MGINDKIDDAFNGGWAVRPRPGMFAISVFALISITLSGSTWGAAGESIVDLESVVADERETIIIRADRAWEEPDSDQVLHFEGNFELIAPEWELRSDEADLYGPLDDPERIVARGAPALLTILNSEENDDGPVIGRGGTIEYHRDTDVLTLTDAAELDGDNISMKSAEIVYDVGANRLKSSGTDGVEMILERAKP